MNRNLLVIILFTLVGCKNFETKKLSSEKLVRDRLEHMDWKSLDTYPSFDACNSYSDKKAKKNCFEKEISSHIFKVLGRRDVVLKDSIHEEIELIIVISSKGKPSIEKFVIPENIENQIPKIEIWLKDAISSLPKIYPAEKRGVPVKSTFKLPLLIQSE